jgi:hypothetical protein
MPKYLHRESEIDFRDRLIPTRGSQGTDQFYMESVKRISLLLFLEELPEVYSYEGSMPNFMTFGVRFSNIMTPEYNTNVANRKRFMCSGVRAAERYIKDRGWDRSSVVECANDGAMSVLATLDRD